MIDKLSSKKVVLASGSPRRKELLKNLKIPFEIYLKKKPEEIFPEELKKEQIAEYLASEKASFYKDIIQQPGTILITADTIVCCRDKVLGKPLDYDEAFGMLKTLSGKVHEVITGVALTSSGKQVVFHSVTKVYFKELPDDEINYYIKTFQPFDKAGAYGIQEWIGMTGIEKIEGSYFNVVGLPVQKLYAELLIF